MAFLRAAVGWFRAYTGAAHAHSGSPPLPSLGSWHPPVRGLVTHPEVSVTHPWEVSCPTLQGSRDPLLRGHSSFTGSLRRCQWKQKPFLPLRGPRHFP